MKVLIVNTSERTGGAAVAASRLMNALCNNGAQAKMLVRDRATDDPRVVSLGSSWWQRRYFLWERLTIFLRLHFRRKHLFETDVANAGFDITRLPEFREADVIHLHWINQGMLSLKSIQRVLRSGKPVVWTMHDLWPATAICHYPRNCRLYCSKCSKCPLLPNGVGGNLAARVWRRKTSMLDKGNIYFVACSRWLEGEARKSALLTGHPVTSIPNAIDTRIYKPADKQEARQRIGLQKTDGQVILFVSQRVTDERKGIAYLIEAIGKLVEQQPELAGNTTVAILGSHADEAEQQLALPVHALGYVSDEQAIVNAYNAADVFVTPSLEDNLPNTIMEAMACGVPCVGFRVGGIPEMIDHLKNGYVAQVRDSSDLAKGIGWVLSGADRSLLSKSALRKVAQNYSQASVALRYTELYQEAIAQKHFQL